MTPEEFRDRGLLQEVNRQFFHPIGMALALQMDDDDVLLRFLVVDTDDKEGMRFETIGCDVVEEMDRKAADVMRLQVERHAVRRAALGYVVQPVAVPVGLNDALRPGAVVTTQQEADAWRLKYEQEHKARCDLERRFDKRLGDTGIVETARIAGRRRVTDEPEVSALRDVITELLLLVTALKVGPPPEARAINIKDVDGSGANEIDFGCLHDADTITIMACNDAVAQAAHVNISKKDGARIGRWLRAICEESE